MSSVLVFLEKKNDEISRISWETYAAGNELGKALGLPVDFAYIANPTGGSLPVIFGEDPQEIHVIDHPVLNVYTADGYTAAFCQLIEKVKPAFVLFPHTYQVRDFAPRLATRFGQVLISDVTGFISCGTQPRFIRQLLQGKLNAEYTHSNSGTCFVSIQSGAFRMLGPRQGSTAMGEKFTPKLEASEIRVQPGEPFRASAQTVDLNSAAILVSVGRGIKEQANLPIVEELAKVLGAELAASRPICDNGWLPMDRQVGSSGQTVAPKVYLAIGISGAIQHLVGMKGSQCIVAINKDENAPIFEVADYGIVGDLFEVVPALTAAVRKVKA